MFFIPTNSQENVILAIGAHPDDIEIGAGGFISHFSKKLNFKVYSAIATNGIQHWQQDKYFEKDTRLNEALIGFSILLDKPTEDIREQIYFGNFVDCDLSNVGHNLIKFIENAIYEIKPDIILTHAKCDLHDDHRQVHYATLSAARNYHGAILFYQAPSTIPNEFEPNLFLKLDHYDYETKRKSIEAHSSQSQKKITSPEYTNNIARAWAFFHRLPSTEKLEAFQLYQSFIGNGSAT